MVEEDVDAERCLASWFIKSPFESFFVSFSFLEIRERSDLRSFASRKISSSGYNP